MKTIWFSHLTDEEEIIAFKGRVLNALDVLSRLDTIARARMAALNTTRVDSSVYDNASWPYLHAHLNGKEETYLELLSILDLNQPEE